MKIYHSILVLLLCSTSLIFSQKNINSKAYETDSQWKTILSEAEYHVLRKAGTEPAFSGKYDKFYKKGSYLCKGCNTLLFKSEHKFDSKSGWPSFDTPIKNNVAYTTDTDLGYTRTEVHCNTCNGHLGHVFNDGPRKTTGKRYCVNSVALTFKPSK